MTGNTRPVGFTVAAAVVVGVVGWSVSPPAAANITPPSAAAAEASGSTPAATTPTSTVPKPKAEWFAPLTGVLYVKGDCEVGGSGSHWLAQRNGHLHRGVDLRRTRGTPILAIHAGVVVRVAYSIDYYDSAGRPVGAGWLVRVYHGRLGGKPVYTTSMHADGRPPVRVGQKVAAGEVIGRVGHSGTRSDHLHFQVHVGGADNADTVNPSVFLRSEGIKVGGC